MHPYYENEDQVLKQLSTWLKQKSPDELTDIIIGYIGESENEQNRWKLAMLKEQGSLNSRNIKKMITKALPKEAVWQRQEVKAYFEYTNKMFEDIFVAIDRLTVDKQWHQILYALQRLNKVLDNIDDSAGFRFDLEGQLNLRLPALFVQQTWSDDEKAQWLFDHYKTWQYDVFPSVPENFTLTDTINLSFRTIKSIKLNVIARLFLP